jgi:hypothetical protein
MTLIYYIYDQCTFMVLVYTDAEGNMSCRYTRISSAGPAILPQILDPELTTHFEWKSTCMHEVMSSAGPSCEVKHSISIETGKTHSEP